MDGTAVLARCAGISAAGIAALTLAVGCGDESEISKEPTGTFPVEITRASFPSSQRLAERSSFSIAVRNAGDRTLPNVAVTIENNDPEAPAEAFAAATEQPGVASTSRPIWVVDDGPTGGVTAFVNTWALGRLAPGRTRTFTWRVTAVKPGVHTVRYRVSAGLSGNAKAELPGGRVPEGRFTVNVSPAPAPVKVTPGGEVVDANPGSD